MTQEALALRSGVTRNVLIDVEQGRRGLLYERLFDLAEALEVPVGELVTGQAATTNRVRKLWICHPTCRGSEASQGSRRLGN